jgi:hypothetical protein
MAVNPNLVTNAANKALKGNPTVAYTDQSGTVQDFTGPLIN